MEEKSIIPKFFNVVDYCPKMVTDITEKDYMDFISIVEGHLENWKEKDKFNQLEDNLNSLGKQFVECYNQWKGIGKRYNNITFSRVYPRLCERGYIVIGCLREGYHLPEFQPNLEPMLHFEIPIKTFFNKDRWVDFFPFLSDAAPQIEWPKVQTSCNLIDTEKEINKKDYFDFIKWLDKDFTESQYNEIKNFSNKLDKLGERFIEAYSQWNNKENGSDNITFNRIYPYVSTREYIVFRILKPTGIYTDFNCHIPVEVLFDEGGWNDYFPNFAITINQIDSNFDDEEKKDIIPVEDYKVEEAEEKTEESIQKVIDNHSLLDVYKIALSAIDKVEAYSWGLALKLKEEGIVGLRYNVKNEYISFNGIDWDLSNCGYIAYEYVEAGYEYSPYYIKVPAEVAFDSNKWEEYIEKEKKVNIKK